MEASTIEITASEITDTDGLRRISEEWRSLVERCERVTPFQSPDWNIPWWDHFGSGKLRTAALRLEDRLVGLALLYLHHAPDGTTRQYSFVGTGNTDYLDALIDPGVPREGAEAVLHYIKRHRDEWDECDLREIKPHSPLLKATAPPGFWRKAEPLSICPVVSLPDTIDAYMGALPARNRRKAEKARRKLENMGRVELELADAHTVQDYMTDFFRLHEARWKQRGEEGLLEDNNVRAFHREAAARFSRSGLLRFYRLTLDGRPISYIYGLNRKKIFYSYLGAFDPEMEHYSPGVVILLLVIEESIRRGTREFDFLRGGEEYKYLWGAKDTFTWRLRIRKSQV